MALKKFNPTTPSQRNLVLVDKSALYKGGPVKKLTEGLSKTGGRNNSGHVTSWQKGGGHKQEVHASFDKYGADGLADWNAIVSRQHGTTGHLSSSRNEEIDQVAHHHCVVGSIGSDREQVSFLMEK